MKNCNAIALRPAAPSRATRTPSLKSVKFKTDPDPPGRKILFRKQATKGLSLTNKGE